MFAIEFRMGNESHDYVYYGEWITLTFDTDEVHDFATAESAFISFILEWIELTDWFDAMWQIRSIHRVGEFPLEVELG